MLRTLVFVGGASRCGSTMLDLLLGQMEGACSVGEIYRIREYYLGLDRHEPSGVCMCGALVRECGYWERILRVFESGPPELRMRLAAGLRRVIMGTSRIAHVSDAVLRTLPPFGPELERIRRYDQLIGAVADHQQAMVVVDSSKQPVYLEAIRRFSGRRSVLKLIVLQRDGRGVVNSMLRHARAGGGARLLSDVDLVRQAARYWKRTYALLDALSARLGPARALTLRYEDVCNHPAAAMARLADFVGLHTSAGQKSICLEGRHNIGGSPSRLGGGVRDIKLDEKWRKQLSEELQAEFISIAGDQNRAMGYE